MAASACFFSTSSFCSQEMPCFYVQTSRMRISKETVSSAWHAATMLYVMVPLLCSLLPLHCLSALLEILICLLVSQVRAGLTPKFKDVQHLCDMLEYDMRSASDQVVLSSQYSSLSYRFFPTTGRERERGWERGDKETDGGLERFTTDFFSFGQMFKGHIESHQVTVFDPPVEDFAVSVIQVCY